MWSNEKDLTIDEVQLLNMVCAKGLRPADNPPDMALVIHARMMYEAARQNHPWEGLEQTARRVWIRAYQRQIKKAWGPFEILP